MLDPRSTLFFGALAISTSLSACGNGTSDHGASVLESVGVVSDVGARARLHDYEVE